MRFEKWQALGNDYVIVEERELPFELTPARVRVALRAAHGRRLGRRAAAVARPTSGDFVAEVRIFNPDGSEAELSGNGVREAVMYLRRNGAGRTTTSSRSRPRPARCGRASRARALHDGHRAGRACARESDFPAGAEDGRGTLTVGRARVRVPVRAGRATRRCAIEAGDELEELDLQRYGPGIERNELFPNRTNVSFWRRDRRRRDPRAHLRARGGGDDGVRHRRHRRGGGRRAARRGRAR